MKNWFILLIPILLIDLVLKLSVLVSVINKKHIPWSKKIGWLIIGMLINYAGPIIYFSIGSAKLDEENAEDDNEHY